MRLGLASVSPAVGLGIHWNRQGRRHLDEDRAVRPTVFKQEHRRAAVLGQPVGEHAARRTGADDYVIESLAIHSRGRSLNPPFVPTTLRRRAMRHNFSDETPTQNAAGDSSQISDEGTLLRPLSA